MSGNKGIITLQFGNYSNYVGTHWWNIQDSHFDFQKESDILHSLLYREGENFKGNLTFTPRLLAYDLQGSVNTDVVTGNLYEDLMPDVDASAVLWDPNKVEDQKKKINTPKHEFVEDLDLVEAGQKLSLVDEYDFNKTVRYWSDFMRTKFHPRSLTLVDGFLHENVDKPFDLFCAGLDVFSNYSVRDEFSENVRWYAEECDYLDGFQIIVDADNGFGGMCSSSIELLDDDYPSRTKLVFSVISNSYQNPTPVRDAFRTVNTMLSMQHFAEHTSLCVPMSLMQTCWRGRASPVHLNNVTLTSSMYETSGVLAACLDTLTLCYRARNTTSRLSDVTNSLNLHGRRLAAASLSLPFPITPGSYLLDTLETSDNLLTGLTPSCQVENDNIRLQHVVLRGVPESKLRNPNLKPDPSNPAYFSTSVKDMLSLYLKFCDNSTVSYVSNLESPLNTRTPFPQFFSPHVSRFGSVDNAAERVPGFQVESVPVMAGLHSCKSLGNTLQTLYDQSKGINVKRFPHLTETHLEEDGFIEALEKLQMLRNCYEDVLNL